MTEFRLLIFALLVAPVSLAIVAATGAFLYHCGQQSRSPLPSLASLNPLRLVRRPKRADEQEEPTPKRIKA